MTLAAPDTADPILEPTTDMAAAYARDGYVSPLDVLTAAEARALRADLEAAEAEFAGDTEKRALLRSYPDRLLPSYHDLIRHPVLLAAATALLGPDLMVWGAQIFTKEPRTPHIVSWHQDLTYWGLDELDEITCWVALSPATAESGCMRFVPGTHRERIVPHVDTFSAENLLSRGQEIAVEVDEADAVHVPLKPGQASIHHGHLFHASGPNISADRRIGLAIRYITPAMRQVSGARTSVFLVQGEDRHGHFALAGAPSGRLSPGDLALCRQEAALREGILYAGTDPANSRRA